MQKAAGEFFRSFPLLRSAFRSLSPTLSELLSPIPSSPSSFHHLPLIKRLSRDEPLLLDAQPTHTSELLDYYDCFLVDCDGVLWRGNHLIDGAVDYLRLLKRRGKKIFFLTNNSTKTCEQYVAKLRSLGIDAELSEICSSAYLLGQYFKETLPNCKKVYVIGQEGIEAELAKVGVETFGGQRDNNKTINEQLFCELELPHHYDAVVCGWDVNFNFYKLSVASLAFQENEKCLFVATNRDAFDRVGNDATTTVGMTRSRINGRCIPGAGGIVAAIEAATNRKPILVGKPSPWIVDFLMKAHDLRRERILMIGDRLDTDILLGRKGNIDTLLVLSGVNSKSDAFETKILPNYIVSSIGALNKF